MHKQTPIFCYKFGLGLLYQKLVYHNLGIEFYFNFFCHSEMKTEGACAYFVHVDVTVQYEN